MEQQTEEQFYEKYKTRPNHIRPNENNEWETYGDELEYIKKLIGEEKAGYIWTIIDNNDGWMGIVAGVHVVNRMCYLVTTKPWESMDEEYTVYDTTELREQWDSLPVAAISEVCGTTWEITNEDDLQDIKDSEFYMWEEASESYRDEILTKYKDQLKTQI